MAVFVTTGLKCWFAEYPLHSTMTSCAINYASELQDDTVFGDTTRSRAGGLKTVAAELEGYMDVAITDDSLYNAIGVVNKPVTVAPITGADGERGFAFLANVGQYTPVSGSLGEMAKFTASAEASGGDTGLIKGTILINASAVTSTANGTAAQLGAVGATQKLYAALHVTSVSGNTPTLDVIVESDDNSGFTSGTTRITFAQATAATSEWATPVSGAITDDWWRIGYTIGAVADPVFTFAVFVGIQ